MAAVLDVDYRDLPRWVGQLGQVARIDSFTEDNGGARGARRVRLVTGGGLEVELHPDRALDIGQVTYRGVPVAWTSPSGVTSPASFDPAGTGWLRTFGGGLLATCGLDSFGPASVHEGVQYGMHGRIGAQPAQLLRTELVDGTLIIVGEVRQSAVLGENVLLRRTVTADVGGSRVRIADTVINEGWTDVGHMVLYHCNLGWPLLSDAAQLAVPSQETRPCNAAARTRPDWSRIGPPTPGFTEQVHCHSGWGPEPVVAVDNPRAGIRLELRFSSSTLPALFQWTMTGEGHYVLGLEPANATTLDGRAAAADAGRLPVVAARSSVDYWIEFTFAPSCSTGAHPSHERSS